MSIGYAYHCDGPDCETHIAPIATPPPYLPSPFMEVRYVEPDGQHAHHFCGWDCLMKYAAKQPLPEVFPLFPTEGDGE